MSTGKHHHKNNQRASGKPVCAECYYFIPKANMCKVRYEIFDRVTKKRLPVDDRTPMHREPYFVQCGMFEVIDDDQRAKDEAFERSRYGICQE